MRLDDLLPAFCSYCKSSLNEVGVAVPAWRLTDGTLEEMTDAEQVKCGMALCGECGTKIDARPLEPTSNESTCDCACGKSYTYSQWESRPIAYTQQGIIWRDCDCGSSISPPWSAEDILRAAIDAGKRGDGDAMCDLLEFGESLVREGDLPPLREGTGLEEELMRIASDILPVASNVRKLEVVK